MRKEARETASRPARARRLLADPVARPSGPRGWAAAYIAYSCLFVVLMWPLYSGRVEPRWDARDEFYPAYTYFADSLREGRFPLWDPYTSCGYPFHAEPHQPTLNPVGILLAFAVSDTALGFYLYWTLHWWWGGAGMLWLSKRLGARPAGALAASLAYAFSGFFVAQAEHTPFLVNAGWLPWIFGLADGAVAGANPGLALLAGAAAGTSTLGGYPGFNYFTGLALALWLALRHLPRGGPDGVDGRPMRTRASWVLGTLGAVAAVMVAAWSPILNAFFREGAGYTDRAAALSVEQAVYGDLFPLPALFSLLFPYATIAGREWMGNDIALTNGYAGALTLPLAVYWFLRGSGKRRPWWILIFFLFMFLVSLGPLGGLRILLHYVYPPMRYVRYSSIFRLYWIFALALGAGLGLTALARCPEDRRFAAAIVLASFVAALPVALALFRVFSSHGGSAAAFLPGLLLPSLAILPAGAAVAWAWATRANGGWSRATPFLVAGLVAADMTGHFHLNSETVYIARDSIRRAEQHHRRTTFVPGDPGRRLPPRPFGYFSAQQVLKVPVVQGYIAMQSKGFDEVLCRSRFVETMQFAPRFWVSPGAEKLSSRDEALQVLSAAGMGSAVPVFLEHPPGVLSEDRAVPGRYGAVRILSYAPEEVRMEAFVPGASAGFLASTERFSAGWKAYVDGRPQKVERVNVYFRGILVPPGTHLVEWRYEPTGWGELVLVGYGSLVLSVISGAALSSRRRMTPPRTLR